MAEQRVSTVPEIRFAGFSEEWSKKQFGDMIDFLLGGASIKPDDYTKRGVRTVPKGAVNATGIADLAGSKFVTVEFYEQNPSNHVSSGDLITSLRDLVPSAPNLGRIVKIMGRPEDFLMPQGVFKIGLDDRSDENFLIAYSNRIPFRKVITAEKNGSTQVHLRNSQFLGIEIVAPKHKEQAQIGSYFKSLDRMIGLHQRKHDKLVTLKQAMLQKMFPQDGATTPEIRFKGFEGEWAPRTLGDVVRISSASRVHKHEWTKSGVPFFRSSDVVSRFKGEKNEKAFISHELYESLSARSGKLEKGDILITGGGSIGIPYQVESDAPLYSKDADLLWLKIGTEIESNFLYTFFLSHQFRTYIKSISHIGTIAHYTVIQATDTPITTPCFDEQQKIGAYFHKLTELIRRHATQLEKLKNIKSACLEKMFV